MLRWRLHLVSNGTRNIANATVKPAAIRAWATIAEGHDVDGAEHRTAEGVVAVDQPAGHPCRAGPLTYHCHDRSRDNPKLDSLTSRRASRCSGSTVSGWCPIVAR